MNIKHKQGFTLLEIIIVIIIIGVLASLALPRFFSTVEFSRSTEAMNAMAVVRKSIERCSVFNNDYSSCNNFTNIDVDDPGLAPEAHFSYTIVASGTSGTKDYTITATRNTKDGGDGTSLVTVHSTTTGVTRSGTTAFASIK